MKIFPSKFSYDTNRYHDRHSHGHDNEGSNFFNDSIVMKEHEDNETLHFRKLLITILKYLGISFNYYLI